VSGALVETGVRLAYRGQQTAMLLACAALQRIARRVALGGQPSVDRDQLRALQRRFSALLARDLANVEAGIYPRDLLFELPLFDYVRALPALARDVPRMVARMRKGDWRDLPDDVDLSAFPPYYRRTFHWQTDGYLSRRSARLYDLEVEFLFGGTADVMRRQVIGPIRRAVERDRPRILDVGCGTGRTLQQIARALPEAELLGIDLSPFYVEVARSMCAAEVMVGNGEAIPLPDADVDAVVSVFVFHELPRRARRRVIADMVRVLRPGGVCVLLDSVQREDARDFAYFVERFGREMHEPFYRDYLEDDLARAMSDAGLQVVSDEPVYLAKMVVGRRVAT
jgi:ubiquinone/menaquinone biosynthesis C-methylase UbiE